MTVAETGEPKAGPIHLYEVDVVRIVTVAGVIAVHVIAFSAVLNDPNIIKPFLAKNVHSAAEVEKMHQAWPKSLWLQVALWSEPYTNAHLAPNEW